MSSMVTTLPFCCLRYWTFLSATYMLSISVMMGIHGLAVWRNSDSKQSHTHKQGRNRTQKNVPMQYTGFYPSTFLQPVNEWYRETWSAGLLWLVMVPMKTFFSVHDNCLWLLNLRFWSNVVCRHRFKNAEEVPKMLTIFGSYIFCSQIVLV